MSTLITRTTTNGDPRLKRMPFAEPGQIPILRLSALSSNAINGETLLSVPLAEGNTSATQGTGDPFSYSVPASSGVPGYKIKATNVPGAVGAKRPTIYVPPNASRPRPKAMMAVFRLIAPANSEVDPTSTSRDSYMHLVGSTFQGQSTIFLTGVNDPGGVANQLRCSGGPGSTRLTGPVVAPDGKLHTVFASANDDGSGSLYFDGRMVETKPGFIAFDYGALISGFALCGGEFDVVEIAHYEKAINLNSVTQKHKHYSNLYQF